MFSYAMGSVAVTYPLQFNAGRGGESSAQRASTMDPEQEHHMCGMLMGCCSPYSSVLNSLLPYVLGGAQMYEGVPPHNRSAGSRKEESAVWVAPGYGPASELSTSLAREAAVKPTQ